MEDFTRILNPGTVEERKHEEREPVPVFVKVEYRGGRLSITGVVGPRANGDAWGSCGQIVETLARKDFKPAPGGFWMLHVKHLRETWARWHLNDMRAGCAHQRAAGWEDVRIKPEELPESRANRDERGILALWVYRKEHPAGLLCEPCPTCGYQYGSKWLREEVPEGVLRFLYELPQVERAPAWV